MEEPLLSSERNGELGEKGSEKWSSYQYVGKAGSVIPTAALAGTEVSVEEIRSAATYSDHYPPSLHAALVSARRSLILLSKLLLIKVDKVMVAPQVSSIGCGGRGDIVCPKCNANQEPGFYKENQMVQCSACFGRGLIAHKDGSDSICGSCNGKGKIPRASCGSCGLIRCLTCQGSGSLLTRNVAVVKWKTLSTRKVSTISGAVSVPDDVFHRAKGVQLCNTQAYQCSPAFFADSFFLN